MRCLVTGGAGFIGSHVVEACLEAGHEVQVVDNLERGRRENLPEGVELLEADIRADAARQRILDWRPEALFHLAAQMDVRKSVADPAFDAEVNVLGMLRLLEACREAGTGRVVFSSTGGAIYGDQDVHPCDETHRTDPVSPYGITKLTGEKYLAFYARQYGLRTVALRYANVYGPRQDPHGDAGVVAIFAQRLLAGEPCTIYGDGEQTRDYVFVGDVVRANMAALGTDHPGVYNVGTGEETSVNALYRAISEACGAEAEPRYAPARPGEQARSAIDPGRAGEVLGWRPEVELAEGLRRTVDWFRDQVPGGA